MISITEEISDVCMCSEAGYIGHTSVTGEKDSGWWGLWVTWYTTELRNVRHLAVISPVPFLFYTVETNPSSPLLCLLASLSCHAETPLDSHTERRSIFYSLYMVPSVSRQSTHKFTTGAWKKDGWSKHDIPKG